MLSILLLTNNKGVKMKIMKKLYFIILILCISFVCTSCFPEMDEETYQEAVIIIYENFGKEIKDKLSIYGIEDLDIQVNNIYYDLNIEHKPRFYFETEFISNSIDKYDDAITNEEKAIEIYTILKNMYEPYQDFLLYEIPYTFEGGEIPLDYNFDFGKVKVKGNNHIYEFSFCRSDMHELRIDGELIYREYINKYPNTIQRPSNGKENQAYFEGYYDVIENYYYDPIRYDSDDYYHMGVDDALAEIDAYF